MAILHRFYCIKNFASVLQDPYVLRQLPFLIGSSNFMEDDNVGIEDMSGEV